MVTRQHRLHIQVGVAAVVDESRRIAFVFGVQHKLHFPASTGLSAWLLPIFFLLFVHASLSSSVLLFPLSTVSR